MKASYHEFAGNRYNCLETACFAMLNSDRKNRP